MAFQTHKVAYQVLERGAYLESPSSMTALGASTTVPEFSGLLKKTLFNLGVYILGYGLVWHKHRIWSGYSKLCLLDERVNFALYIFVNFQE